MVNEFKSKKSDEKIKLEKQIWGAERTLEVDADFKDLELSATIARKRIGSIYIGYEFLVKTFKEVYKNNPNAGLGEFLRHDYVKFYSNDSKYNGYSPTSVNDLPPPPPGYHYMPDGTLMTNEEHKKMFGEDYN